MATLQELNRNLQAIRKNLSTYEAQKTKAVDDLRTANTSLKDLSKTIRELEETMSATDKIISSQKTDDALKTQLEEQRAKLDKELKEARAERTRLEKVITARTEAEKNITSANSQMDKIILEFASDPRINGHLQEAINYKYTDEMTCKEYGIKTSQKRKENEEPIYGKYRQIYARKAMMVKRNPDIEYYKTNYEKWKKEAKNFINDIKACKKTYDEFNEWLDENRS